MKENNLPVTPKTGPTAAPDLACPVIRDLMPLVHDGVASEESEQLVRQHIQTCASCRQLWQTQGDLPPAPETPDDTAVLHRVRTHLRLWLLVLIAVGLTLGSAALYSGRATGLVFVVFPLICGIARCLNDNIWKLVLALSVGIVAVQSLAVFGYVTPQTSILETVWIFFQNFLPAAGFVLLLCLLGVLIASLLLYAVKGRNHDETR